jgi:hypothetical protein
LLPADAADAEAGDLVAALAAEQPGQRDRADEFQRVGRLPIRAPAIKKLQVIAYDLGL